MYGPLSDLEQLAHATFRVATSRVPYGKCQVERVRDGQFGYSCFQCHTNKTVVCLRLKDDKEFFRYFCSGCLDRHELVEHMHNWQYQDMTTSWEPCCICAQEAVLIHCDVLDLPTQARLCPAHIKDKQAAAQAALLLALTN